MSTRVISFKDAIREATDIALQDKNVFLIGEGVGDPKQIFGTTTGLKDKYPNQVFDMPISENGLTGVCIGCAINGLKPVLVHQRMDFSLYAMDQMVNNAAKWFSMFGGQRSCPIVVRLIIGRGWGQGNQHSQNLTALYAHVPGLKIVVPSSARNAAGLFLAAVKDPNPVLFIEHRWLHETTSEVGDLREINLEIGQPIAPGNINRSHVTVVASGHSYRECLIAQKFLEEKVGIRVHLIDLCTIRPLSMDVIRASVEYTGRLVVVDDAWPFGGLASEIITQVVEAGPKVVQLDSPPVRVTYPDYPSASSPSLTKNFYNGPYDICKGIEQALGKELPLDPIADYQAARVHDVPDQNFKGPF